MGSSFNSGIIFSIFGQSHSPAIGVCVEGFPVGFKPDMQKLAEFMARRAPGGRLTTKRKEADEVEVLSGMADGVFCGAPLCAVIKNTDAKSGDYSGIKDMPRPGHADMTAEIKYRGYQDVAGGGHFSGRLTAPLCIAGGLALQVLEEKGIYIRAHIKSIADITEDSFDVVNVSKDEFDAVLMNEIPVINNTAGEKMLAKVEEAAANGDSLGGVIECAAINVPAGLGDPMFDGMENVISRIVFGIPAVKAIEFGAGFNACGMCGSENNDEYYMDGNDIKTYTNNAGGILGGITTGMPIIFRAGFKPTPSIFKEQRTVSFAEKKNVKNTIRGRHDPAIVLRAAPCIEAAAAIAILDAFIKRDKQI